MNQSLKASKTCRAFLLSLAFVFIIQNAYGQIPKREFRGVWVSTVANIDWPSASNLSTQVQQEEIMNILDKHKQNGINAIILQVRPTADAIYTSELEPWSRYLSGQQGIAPEPFYDPLEFWIREAHLRGMELHAWFNPYRIKLNQSDSLAGGHVFYEHPEWTFTYGERTYFSPANPAVWEYVTSVVVDVVNRYDVDAVHFDDYFYPYQIAGEELPDSLDFVNYGGAYYPERLEDWRRHNVDTIIQMLGKAIKETKPWVKFGISPFGVWRNNVDDPMGSETTAGTSNYDGLYADVLLWQQNGWIDYLMPQLYWRDDHPAVGFSTLAYWWNDFGFGRSIYVGLAPYRLDKHADHKLWRKEKFLIRQIELLRELNEIEGFAYFSSKHFFRSDLKGLNRKLQKSCTPYPALVPLMPWIDNQPPAIPTNLRLEGKSLTWDSQQETGEMDRARFFVLYRFDPNENSTLKSVQNIVDVSSENRMVFEESLPPGVYRVSALDRLQNESQLSIALEIK
jgi:uncharacterized lipoprotein YddW (UPF0748 family)